MGSIVQSNNLKSIQSTRNFEDLQKQAGLFYQSGMFSDIKSAAQAAVKIYAGNAVGVDPFTAVSQIYIISGKIVMSAGLQARCLKASGKYNYKVVTKTTKECVIDFYEKWDGQWEKVGTEEFTWDDAVAAKLAGKDVWKSYPKNMLFNRCMTNGIRTYAPDALGQTVYDAEELTEVKLDGEGNTVPIQVEVIEPKKELPFKTPQGAIEWAMKQANITEEEANEVMRVVAPDEQGKKSQPFYDAIMNLN
jgi:hypothetical protein